MISMRKSIHGKLSNQVSGILRRLSGLCGTCRIRWKGNEGPMADLVDPRQHLGSMTRGSGTQGPTVTADLTGTPGVSGTCECQPPKMNKHFENWDNQPQK